YPPPCPDHRRLAGPRHRARHQKQQDGTARRNSTTDSTDRQDAEPMGLDTNYDPVEVAVLSEAEIQRYIDDALAAIAGAADLDELKRVRLDHAGDRSPLALANREIGALPPAARKEAGRRVGTARARVGEALTARQAELEAERDATVLRTE